MNSLKVYDLNRFKNDLDELNIYLNEKQMEQFIQYYELLIEWNSFINLTSITDYDEVLKKHFIDSLSIVKAYNFNIIDNNMNVIDIGTGAGFPGIPIKIAFPDIKITLLDSLKKRISFLEEVINKLELENISAIHGRAEDYARPDQLREKYDLCISRAVASLSTLSEYCIPFIKNNGIFICYKSEKITEELLCGKKAVSILGGKIEKQIDYMLPSSNIYRSLLVIKKVKKTPLKFPRKAGIPSKEPIN